MAETDKQLAENLKRDGRKCSPEEIADANKLFGADVFLGGGIEQGFVCLHCKKSFPLTALLEKAPHTFEDLLVVWANRATSKMDPKVEYVWNCGFCGKSTSLKRPEFWIELDMQRVHTEVEERRKKGTLNEHKIANVRKPESLERLPPSIMLYLRSGNCYDPK
eukprot:Phypoly_transcript_17872.p1 GENE.Phypoly_transcript_17872~~Phypoly_transcript_17872.p1  ORF type:complete len:163 (+),score=32.13 Phypoly_transcript_17872:181-669(+)